MASGYIIVYLKSLVHTLMFYLIQDDREDGYEEESRIHWFVRFDLHFNKLYGIGSG